MAAQYFFGSFQINANNGAQGYFLLSKNFDTPTITPGIYYPARRDGAKKSGEQVKERIIDVQIQVVGTSYTDLISRLDSLQQALSLRSQQLCIHPDGRYFQGVDCVDATAKLVQTNVISAIVEAKFTTYDPYAYAATSSSYDTGTVALTLSNNLYNFPTISLIGGGDYYAYPLIHIINKTSSGNSQWTSVSVTQNQDSQTLTVSNSTSAQLPINNGDYMDIQCNPAATSGWSVQTNSSGNFSDPQGLFPVIEPGTTTFNIAIASASAVSAECVISWQARYMS